MAKVNSGYVEEMVTIRSTGQGEFIRRKPGAKKVYIRGHYVRELRAFSCSDTEDMNREIFIKAGALVQVGFTY